MENDLSALLSDLGTLEEQLVSASRLIGQQREAQKVMMSSEEDYHLQQQYSSTAASSMNASGLMKAPLPNSGNTPSTFLTHKPTILPCEGFRLEDGSENPLSIAPPTPTSNAAPAQLQHSNSFSLTSPNSGSSLSLNGTNNNDSSTLIERHILVENADQDTTWYFRYFLGQPHHNFIGYDDQKMPYVLSVVTSGNHEEFDITNSEGQAAPPLTKSLTYGSIALNNALSASQSSNSTGGTDEVPTSNPPNLPAHLANQGLNQTMPTSSPITPTVSSSSTTHIRAILWRKTGTEKILISTKKADNSRTEILKAFHHSYSKWAKPKPVSDPALIKDLTNFEDQLSAKKFKFGIIYAKEGQVADDEFFSNEHGSNNFNEFINLLGDKIELKGWKGFRAGLDVINGNTGTHSIYTEYIGYEIMFHVSTLLPYSPTNTQQLERKRHIGNDIVIVVFQEGNSTPFSPAFMRTHFNHIFMVVRRVDIDGKKRYKLAVCTKDSVPPFGPPLPDPPYFEDPILFRKFLLTKLINAENAAYTAPAFSQKMERTAEAILTRIAKECLEKSEVIQRKGSKGNIEEYDYGIGLKEEILREKEHVHLSITSRVNERPMAWKLELFTPNFTGKVFCADSWGEKLFLANGMGLYLNDGKNNLRVWDATNLVALKIIDHLGILLALSSKNGKGGYLYCFPLNDLMKTLQGKCQSYRIEKTKGCHMFTTSSSGKEDLSSKLFVCAAMKANLTIYEYSSLKWKKTKEFVLPDTCCVLSFCDMNSKLCVGFKTEFNLIDIKTSSITELFVAANKLYPLAAIPLENELLLCYSHMGIFRGFDAKKTREYDLNWTSIPHGIAYSFPFVLAFSNDSIEIRTLINGKLVQTLSFANIKFLTAENFIYLAKSPEEKFESDIYRIIFRQ